MTKNIELSSAKALCLNCQKPLAKGQLKFCSRLCEKRSQRRQQLAKKHHIVAGNIEIVARLKADNKPEWILPGCYVTDNRYQAEAFANQLYRFQQKKAA